MTHSQQSDPTRLLGFEDIRSVTQREVGTPAALCTTRVSARNLVVVVRVSS